MSVACSPAVSINALPGWNIFFAKEPAPAGDPGQPDMDKTVVLGPPGKKGPTPPSMKERILFLVLVLIIVGAGGYLAVNPDILMNLLGDSPGDVPPQMTVRPPAKPAAKAPAPAPASAMPAAPAATVPKPAAPAPTPMSATVASVPAPAPAPAPASSAAPSIPTPRFGEGEKVSVSAPTPLTADSAGRKPGTATVAPGATLVVLDADLQNFAWVYSVRTEQGATGWVAEKNLVAK